MGVSLGIRLTWRKDFPSSLPFKPKRKGYPQKKGTPEVLKATHAFFTVRNWMNTVMVWGAGAIYSHLHGSAESTKAPARPCKLLRQFYARKYSRRLLAESNKPSEQQATRKYKCIHRASSPILSTDPF